MSRRHCHRYFPFVYDEPGPLLRLAVLPPPPLLAGPLSLGFFVALGVTWWYRRSGMATGYVLLLLHGHSDADRTGIRTIRLPGGADSRPRSFSSDASIMDNLASVPWYVVGMVGIAWEKVASMARRQSSSDLASKTLLMWSMDQE